MRSLTVDMLSALAAENVIPVVLVELDFVSGFVRVHSGVGTLTFSGNTFLGVGTLGRVNTIEESTELQAYGLNLELTGIPNTMVGAALTEHYQSRAARIWVGAMDSGHRLLADPVLAFAGRMDNMEISIDEVATITLAVENQLVDWDRPRIRRFNNADQQAEYPGDLGLEFAEAMVNKTLFWGKVSSI